MVSCKCLLEKCYVAFREKDERYWFRSWREKSLPVAEILKIIIQAVSYPEITRFL